MAYNIGESSMAGQDVKPSTQLDDAYEALRQAYELSGSVLGLTNRLLGGVPTGKDGAKLEAVSDGIMADLSLRAREVSRMVSEANEAVQRMNRAFGL